MQQFPNFRQPALGIQDAAMLPAQNNVNQLVQRAVAAQSAYVPATQTFDSTTSSTQLNATVASASGGSVRNLMIPTGNAGFVQILPPSQFPDMVWGNVGSGCSACSGCSSCQTSQGSSAGMAIFGGAGISLFCCGCGCTKTLADEVIIDEENSNGIDDGTAVRPSPQPPVYDPPVEGPGVEMVTRSAAAETAAAPTAPAANIQYVTYNA